MKKKKKKLRKFSERIKKFKNTQRETTLRLPLRRRCPMGDPLTPIRNLGVTGFNCEPNSFLEVFH